jgi:hypothetical protein
MKLADLLAALSSNTNTSIVLLDSNDNEMITFKAAGYASVNSELGEREVKRIKIATPSYSVTSISIRISVEDAANNDPTPEPDPEP